MAKCWSTSFILPLHTLKNAMIELARRNTCKLSRESYLTIENIEDEQIGVTQIEGLSNYLRKHHKHPIDFMCLQTPTNIPSYTVDNLSLAIKNRPPLITTIRSPKDRLKSMIKQLAPKAHSFPDLISLIDDNIVDFDNYMYCRLISERRDIPKNHSEEQLNQILE